MSSHGKHAHLSLTLTRLGLVPALKAFKMPLSSSLGRGGSACRRALIAGGNARFSAASVAGRPRQNATSAGSPATAAITAMRAAVLHGHHIVSAMQHKCTLYSAHYWPCPEFREIAQPAGRTGVLAEQLTDCSGWGRFT